jgi:AcrR family transcriptional regulator
LQQTRPTYDIDSLTDVALRVFAERGFDGASMDDVARKAGITKAAIYHHVSGKEELLERGLSRALEALFAVLEERSATAGTPRERVRYIVERVAALALGLRPELTVLVRVRGNSKTERRAIERRRSFDAIVTELVAQAQAAGEMDPALDAGLVVRLMFGLCNSLVEWYRPGGALRPETVVATVVRLVFDGAAAPCGTASTNAAPA